MTSRVTALLLVVLDVVASIVVFNLISYARGLVGPGHFIIGPLAVPIIVFASAIYLVQGYWPRTDMLSVDYASQHVIATMGAMICTLLVTYAVFPGGYELQSSRFVIALSFIALIPLTLGYRRLIHLHSIATTEARNIVFVGDRESCNAFRKECSVIGMAQQVLYSEVGTERKDTAVAGPSGGELRAFSEILTEIDNGRLPVEAVVLRESAHELQPDISAKLVRLYFAGVPTYTLELFHEVYWQKIPLYRLNQTWLFQEGFKIAREPVFERTKRVTDVILASIALVVSLPFLALASVAIWLEDRGPAIFTQMRIGRNHVPFKLFKLRTMKVAGGGDRYTRPGDSRITRVGRFLRSSRLDEVPQLFNVLRGDMSLIGPRAEWDQLVIDYERQIPCYYFRHLVRPGITGWAQVNYPYGAGIEDTLRKLEYDLYYIRHFSFRLDATIVLKTIHIMLFGKGR